jgi:hypothetical protein
MTDIIEKQIGFKEKLVEFYNANKLKLYCILFFIIIFFAIVFYFKFKSEQKNILISEKYIQAGIYLTSNKKDEAKKIYEEIILDNNEIYSILALNKILEKNLITDKQIILEYFDLLQKSISENELKDLINLKKALFLIKTSESQSGYDLLEKLVEKNSNLKSIAEQIIEK